MRKTILLSALFAVGLFAAQPARAVLVAYEDFESYTAGSDVNGGTGGAGWASNWVATASQATVQTKTLTNALVDGGSQALRIQPTANISNNENIIDRNFSSLTGDVYVGMLLRVESYENDDFLQLYASNGATTGNSSGSMAAGILNTTNNPFFVRVAGQNTTSSTTTTDGTDYLVVTKYSKDGSGMFNRTDLYVNPPSTAEPGTTDVTRVGPDSTVSALSQFHTRVFSLETDDSIFLDELRVGTTFADAILGTTPPPATQIVLDSEGSPPEVTRSGFNSTSTSKPGYIGNNYRHDSDTNKGNQWVTYTPDLGYPGFWEVEAIWTSDNNRADNVPIDILGASGLTTVYVDQTADGGVWNSLGVFSFYPGTQGSVTIRNMPGDGGYVIADGIRFTLRSVPEPGAWLLLGLGTFAWMLGGRRRRPR